MSTVGQPAKKDIDEAESKPDLIKVTVLLPQDTIDKLDSMSKMALLGSRGRTIQSLVDSVWDSKTDISNIIMHAKTLQTLQNKTAQETTTALLMILFNLSNLTARINKFLGIT
jgi:metal-responsive CopG/Arc/MetJ family transcriptional regulator